MIVILFSASCSSTVDLLSESQPIPFLSSVTDDVIELIDDSDHKEEGYQRIIWKVDKSDKFTAAQIIRRGKEKHFGGLILNGYTVEEYLDIRNQLDTVVSHPLFYGTEEVLLLNGQFANAEQVIPAMMVAATGNAKIEKTLEDQFHLQQSILGINFSASVHNQRYSTKTDWRSSYDFKNGSPDFYQQRIKKLNNNRSISMLRSFNNEILAAVDSTLNIDSIYLHTRPYIQVGISAVAIDSSVYRHTTNSAADFFRSSLDFRGLLVADVHTVADVSKTIDMGVDIILVDRPDIRMYSAALKKAISKASSSDQLNAHRKVLLAKHWVRDETPTRQTNYKPWLSIAAETNIDEGSTVLVNNHKNLLPFTSTYRRNFRLLSYGRSPLDTMEYVMHKFADHKRNFYNTAFGQNLKTNSLTRYRSSTIIITLDSIDIDARQDSSFIQYVNDISATRKVALVNFGNPDNLMHFDSTLTMLQLFRRTDRTEVLAAHILFGGASAPGRLPVSLNQYLMAGTSLKSPITRWRYVSPEDVGIDENELYKIALVADEGHKRKAFPGCQVFVVKDGNVIYNEGLGSHTYSRKNRQAVIPEDIYDIASITKIAATTLATMRLFEEKKIHLNSKLSKYIDIAEDSQIADVSIRELLTHTSGIQAGIPISFIRKDNASKTGIYKSTTYSEAYPIKAANNFYLTKATHDSIWAHVEKLSAEHKTYKYSDVNMYLLQKVIEAQTGMSIAEYTAKYFYKPLGLKNIGYNPLKTFKTDQIVPTQNDKQWRGQQLDGYVHDPAAALLGGISGNAGLFSNAHDLAVIGQMLLNGGTYGGRRYFQTATVDQFTSATIIPNRGLGFESNKAGRAKVGERASARTYGHIGFTGTAMWIDPEEQLVYVFLSNRIHPVEKNPGLNSKRYRQRIHDVIYKAIDKGRERVEGDQISVAP